MSSALDRRAQTRVVISVIVQALVAVTVLLVLYYVVPTPGSRVGPVVSAIVFLGIVSLELRAVVRDPLPVPRAAVAMGRLLPLFIVLFAWSYVAMSRSDPSAFSEPLTRSAALYFTVTVLSTVGFGDITPVADVARLMVSVQMISDLVVIAIIVKLITGVAKHARAQKTGAGSGGLTQPRPGEPRPATSELSFLAAPEIASWVIGDRGMRKPGGDVRSFGMGEDATALAATRSSTSPPTTTKRRLPRAPKVRGASHATMRVLEPG